MRYAIPRRILFQLILALAILAGPDEGRAQLAPIGLSEVRSHRVENEDLVFYVPEAGDRFGSALAAGDFNGDGASDLATGVPFDNGRSGFPIVDCGIVVIRYAEPGTGLAGSLAESVLYQGLVGSPSSPAESEYFGAALAAGDFNGDGFDDLAVGAPGDKYFPAGSGYGAVLVYYGGPNGIEPPQGAELLDESLDWQEVDPEFWYDAEFGDSLAVGNFDGDAYDDLAIGAPGARVGIGTQWLQIGEVFVAHGSADGLLPLSGYGISQHSSGIHGDAEVGDRFGDAVAAGDFNGDGIDDLAIGVPKEDDSGAVNILFGSQSGLIFASDVYWLQWAAGLEPEAGDLFGFALAAADLDGDGHDDLVIGNPAEDLGTGNEILDAGQVSIFYGSPTLFDYARTRNFTQEAIQGSTEDEDGDRFGQALAAGDFDGDGRSDIAVSHPGEDDNVVDGGALTVLMGGPGGTLGDRSRLLVAGLQGLPGDVSSGAQNGRALAVGDFDGTGFADLAFGAPFQFVSGLGSGVGDVKVIYGSLFADGFGLGSALRWGGVVP